MTCRINKIKMQLSNHWPCTYQPKCYLQPFSQLLSVINGEQFEHSSPISQIKPQNERQHIKNRLLLYRKKQLASHRYGTGHNCKSQHEGNKVKNLKGKSLAILNVSYDSRSVSNSSKTARNFKNEKSNRSFTTRALRSFLPQQQTDIPAFEAVFKKICPVTKSKSNNTTFIMSQNIDFNFNKNEVEKQDERNIATADKSRKSTNTISRRNTQSRNRNRQFNKIGNPLLPNRRPGTEIEINQESKNKKPGEFIKKNPSFVDQMLEPW